MARIKGSQKTGGRQKGTPNKIDGCLRKDVLDSFYAVGGVDWLIDQANKNPIPYMSILGKCLPKEINATVDSQLNIIINKPTSTLLDK